jgi:hypothetical protein
LNGFHWKPKVIIKDCCPAIKNAFTKVFGDSGKKAVDCWFHVKQNLIAKLKSISDQTLRASLKADINILQSLPTGSSFNHGLNLFLNFWEKVESVATFLAYFKSQYVRKFPGWYEAFAPGFPSTNNNFHSL